MTMRFSLALLALLASAPLVAQDATRQVTAADYTRAERFLSQNTNSLVFGASVSAQWLGDGRFWYRSMVPGGTEFVMVDPSEGTRERAFDHERIANVLNAVSGEAFESLSLPLNGLSLEGNDLEATVGPPGHFRCNLTEYSCESVAVTPGPTVSRLEVVSPDARNAVFIRDHNLWVRDLGTGDESALTTDGVEDFGYGTNNAGWTRSDRPILKWSPDSRKIATFRHDARGVGMMYLVNTQVGHPQLDAWRYPLPEDSVIFRISRVVLNLDRPAEDQIVSLAMPPDQHRSTCSDHIACGGSFGDVEWSLDSERIVFVSSARDHKTATVRIANTSTGAVTVLFEEVEETFYESNGWDFLSSSNEILWFSQRDDWGHLYLYDAGTGALKRQVTQGDWNVLRIMEIDEGARTVTFIGNEREPGDPYFQYLYRTGLDGGDVELLTPDSANHTVSLSPDGKYLVDTYSTPVIPPVTVLRDREDGSRILAIEEADISRLQASGWQPPMPFSVKARDGETDLYGLLFRPMNFDPGRSYPIVNYLYPGPQSGSVGSRSFRASHRDLQAIAELGFVVVELDAMGTPGRSKTFHEAYYGNMGDNGLPDQIAGIRQLADRYPWMDIDKVGIYGHSGGGFAAAAAVMRYPDFYDVAVSQAGNHDQRNYEDDWGEKWQGLLVEYPDGTTNYDNQANQLLAENLKGKLLIAHGTLDSNVPPSNTMLVVNALIAANKDFDLILMPNRSHGFGNEPYMMRRRWDYFVRHLLDAEPPAGYEIGQATRPIG
ncbi:MAG TPA: S9 family peptidase [Gemmatimonadetes bacterium]|nr:S9 family peptidase [Gemmatimonadota bacterium]